MLTRLLLNFCPLTAYSKTMLAKLRCSILCPLSRSLSSTLTSRIWDVEITTLPGVDGQSLAARTCSVL